MLPTIQKLPPPWRFIVDVGLIVLIGLNLFVGSLHVLDDSLDDEDLCHDRQDRVMLAKEAFVRTQDPIIIVSGRTPRGPAERAKYEESIELLRVEAKKIADELYPPVEC